MIKPQATAPHPQPVAPSKNRGTHRAGAISVVVVAFQVVRLVEQLLEEKHLATSAECQAEGLNQNRRFHQHGFI